MAGERDGFLCCGGNDETPIEHTLDCWKSIDRFTCIEIAARAVVRRPTSKRALARLRKVLNATPSGGVDK